MKNDKENLKRIGQRLREIRLKRGLTLEQVEERGFPSWRHLQKLEAGKNFTMVTLAKLGEAYGMNLSEILKGV